MSAITTAALMVMGTLVAIIAASALLPAQSAEAVWFNSNWDYRVKVEIAPSKVGTTSAVTNFPVYLDLAGMPASFWSTASTGDVRVVESDEITETAFEIVSFSTSTARGELHFLADSLSTTSSSTFYIYYGNPAASAYAVTDTYGRNNVWTRYLAVYHASGTTDSTGNYDLSNSGVTFSAGQIGNGADFDTSTDRMLNSNTAFDFQSTKNFTVSHWVDLVSVGSNQFFVGNQDGGGNFVGWNTYQGASGEVNWTMVQSISPVRILNVKTAASTLGTSRTHISYTKQSGTAPTDVKIYVDGTERALTTVTNNLSNTLTYNSDFQLGNRATAFNMNGQLDEVRVGNEVFDLAYIRTEYNNQSSTSTFFFIGPEDTDAPAETTTTPQTVIQGGVFGGGTLIR